MKLSTQGAKTLLVLASLLLLAGCPPEKDSNTFAPPTPIKGPVEAVPVNFEPLAALIPVGTRSYQLVQVEWEGMKPVRATYEHFVRGSCYVQAHYVLAEGGGLTQVAPFFRSAQAGKSMEANALLITRAIEIATSSDRVDKAFLRDSLGKLAWVWEINASSRRGPKGIEKIWTFSYPEEEVCVAPAIFSRENIPAKVKPTRVPSPSLPGKNGAKTPRREEKTP